MQEAEEKPEQNKAAAGKPNFEDDFFDSISSDATGIPMHCYTALTVPMYCQTMQNILSGGFMLFARYSLFCFVCEDHTAI